MKSRPYTISFANVSVAVIQDLFSILSTSGMAWELHEIRVGQITTTSIAVARVRLLKLTGGFSQGSVGSTPTPQPLFGTQAATVTAHCNDTTQASGGTITTLISDVFNYVNGFLYLPAEDDRPVFAPSQLGAFVIDNIPITATMNGSATIGELF